MTTRGYRKLVASSLREAMDRLCLAACLRAAHRAAATGMTALLAANISAAEWKTAEPGWQYEFPRDHRPHRDFKTEWWYFTGNVFDTDGNRFGYELTFFRQGIAPIAKRDPNASRFLVDDLKFAHFAITDVAKQKFRFEQKTSRGAFGEAGFDDATRLAWIDNWTLATNDSNSFELTASSDAATIHLHLRATQPPVIHGENGVSVKAAGGSSSSHYYSMPRLQTKGEIILDGRPRAVSGESWFDHEWSSSQLGKDQVGWDWLCVQWEDGAELMLYRMRLANGEAEASSSGTWIAPDGTTTHLRVSDFQMTPITFWKSRGSGGQYPIGWRIALPGRRLEFTVRALLDDQELKLGPITYWEGAIDVKGTSDGKAIEGRGYLELTGYAPGSQSLGR